MTENTRNIFVFFFYRGMYELSSEQMKTLRTIYELVCHLMHSSDCSFLLHFCESVYVIADDLLRHFYANGMCSRKMFPRLFPKIFYVYIRVI